MKSNARYISLVALVAAFALVLTSCADKANLFAPKKMFYGTIKNVTQWLLYVPNPANQQDVHELSPNVYFSCELEGSRVYRFEAKLPDGVTYAAFDARINQLSSDAPVNGVNVDWAWIIGGPFYYSVSPVGGGDASAHLIEITNFDSIDPTFEQPKVMGFNDVSKMSESIVAFGKSHPVPSQGRLFPGHERNFNIYRGQPNVIVDQEVK